MGAEARELLEEELEALATVSERGAVPSCPDWWKLWVRDRIEIRNNTGSDMVVMVHRFKDVSQLTSLATEANANINGAGLKCTAEWARIKGHAQVEPIASGVATTVDLGGGAKGAYVTAWKNDGHYDQVYIMDKHVKPRWLLTVTPGHIQSAQVSLVTKQLEKH